MAVTKIKNQCCHNFRVICFFFLLAAFIFPCKHLQLLIVCFYTVKFSSQFHKSFIWNITHIKTKYNLYHIGWTFPSNMIKSTFKTTWNGTTHNVHGGHLMTQLKVSSLRKKKGMIAWNVSRIYGTICCWEGSRGLIRDHLLLFDVLCREKWKMYKFSFLHIQAPNVNKEK